jgi:hypothetical protein
MAVGIALFVVSVLIIAIWLIIELKRFKHKIFAMALIGFILLGYLSFTFVFKDSDVDLKTIDGLITGSKMYGSWLGSTLVNFKSLTTNAIKMDWSSDESLELEEE